MLGKKSISTFLFFIVVFFCTNFANAQSLGYLKIKLNKSGAKIFADGKLYKSDVPANEEIVLELLPGQHEIRSTKAGYIDELRKITIKSDEVSKLTINFRTVSEIELKEEERGTQVQGYGKLTVISNPAGAKILVDGSPFKNARTPDTFEKIPAGSINLGVESDKGIRRDSLVYIEKDRVTKVVFDLNPKFGTLTVISDPIGANVFINSKFYDTTPFSKELLIGNYQVSVKADGWKTENQKLLILNKKITVMKAVLHKDLGNIILEPEDIGRVYKPYISLDDFKREEYEYKKVKRKWAVPAFIASTLAFTGGIIMLNNAPKEPDGSLDVDKMSTLEDVSMLGLIVSIFSLPASTVGMFVKEKKYVPIEENIAYNKQKQLEIEGENEKIKKYNEETEHLLEQKKEKQKKEIEEFNRERNTTVKVK